MGDDDKEKKEARLLSVSWNQDASCFTAATTAYFRVFDVHHPLREKLRRVNEDGGGFAAAEMLFRSNIFAVVPSDRNVVEVWDDARRKPIWQLGYSSTDAVVRSVRLSRNRVAVAFDRMVRVYDLLEPRRPAMCKAETAPNPRGLLCLSCRADAPTVVACPGTARGQVRVQHLDKDDATRFVITAHGSDLACMAMTVDGTVLATASIKGTLVRVFHTVDGTCLQEVRRGRDTAEIYSIAIAGDLKWLAVSSDKGTVHVFSLVIRKDDVQSAATSVPPTDTVSSNARSSLSFMKGFLPNYFSSEWSIAQFRLPKVTRCIVAFGEQNTVMIVGMDARCSFDPVNGGDMVRKEYFRFLNAKKTPVIRTS